MRSKIQYIIYNDNLFHAPAIRGKVINLYLANNVWLKVPAKSVFVPLFPLVLHISSAPSTTSISGITPVDHWVVPDSTIYWNMLSAAVWGAFNRAQHQEPSQASQGDAV